MPPSPLAPPPSKSLPALPPPLPTFIKDHHPVELLPAPLAGPSDQLLHPRLTLVKARPSHACGVRHKHNALESVQPWVVVREGIQAHVRDMTCPHIRQVPLGIDVEIVRDGEPEMPPATTEPVLQDQAGDGAPLAHARCEE